jgi:hypothetical protein
VINAARVPATPKTPWSDSANPLSSSAAAARVVLDTQWLFTSGRDGDDDDDDDDVRDGRTTDFETAGTKADTLALPSTSAARGRNEVRTFMARINRLLVFYERLVSLEEKNELPASCL